MRITPLAVFCYKLSKDELYQAVKLQTAMTHSNPVAFEACYLYCVAIASLIKHGDRIAAFQEALEEAMRPGVSEEVKLAFLLEKVRLCKSFQEAQ